MAQTTAKKRCARMNDSHRDLAEVNCEQCERHRANVLSFRPRNLTSPTNVFQGFNWRVPSPAFKLARLASRGRRRSRI